MKLKLLFLLSFFLWSAFAFVPGLLEQGRKMVGLIEKARTCSVKMVGNDYRLRLCTGLELEKEDLKFLKDLTLNSCQQFLVQMGYKVHKFKTMADSQGLINEGKLEEAVVQDFFNSTKLAWILHKEKAILFKPEAQRGDCIHEVLHFYQRQRPRKNELAPLERKGEERRLQFLLEKAVAEVEKVEKEGNKEKAKDMAGQLQPFISLQREWQKLLHWLDEKEIYQAFFDFPHLFKLGERDQDIALANLVRLKDSLPWDLKERVLHQAQVALNNKYRAIKTPKGLAGFKSEEEYGQLYNRGKISRDRYEEKVIAMRKYKAWQQVVKARREGDLLETLKGLGLAREFAKEQKIKAQTGPIEFTYKLYKELPSIEIEGEVFIIDTGANESVLPPHFLKKFKEKDILLLGLKRLRTVVGTSDQAPVIQILKKIQVAGHQISGLTFTVSELGLPGISGILGIDFFMAINDGRWFWDVQSKKIGPMGKQSFAQSFYLQSNGRGQVDALEFMCKDGANKLKIRFDSGSQVWGDRPKGKSYAFLEKCLPGIKEKALLEAPQLSALFLRNVDLNVGHAYLQTINDFGFDLKKRELYFNSSTNSRKK